MTNNSTGPVSDVQVTVLAKVTPEELSSLQSPARTANGSGNKHFWVWVEADFVGEDGNVGCGGEVIGRVLGREH